MAIAYGGSATINVYGTSGSGTMSFSGSNRYVFALSTQECSAITINGVSMSILNSYTPPSYGGNAAPPIRVWGLANPTTGSQTVSVTSSGTTYSTAVLLSYYTGASSTQPDAYNTNETGTNTQTSITDTITITTDSSWLISCVGASNMGSSATLGAGTSTTLRQQVKTDLVTGYSVVDSNAAKTPTGSYSLQTTTSSGSARFGSIMYSIEPYISYSFSGPSSGNVNSASTNFTVTPDVAITGTITITPSGTGSAGLSPVVLSFSNSATPQTFTITPTTAGSITLTPTNGLGLDNPSSLSYTANAVVPDAPTIGTAIPGNTQATVNFSAPSNTGGAPITEYRATSTPGGFTATGSSSPLVVTGLSNGTGYTFTVRATNSAGNSVESSASNSVTPYVSATSFTFTGPSSGNVRSASTDFTVTPNAVYYGTITITPTGAGSSGLSATTLTWNGTSTAQTFTITPIESGSITLTPTNSNGLSNPSNLTYTANAVVPLAPQITLVSAGDSQAFVSIGAPSNDGGSDVTSYTVTSTPGSFTAVATTATTVTVTGLENGTSYTFVAKATNSIGDSANSDASDPVIPRESSSDFTNNAPKFGISGDVGNVIQFNI
jgi:hypothetical protein